MTITTDQIQGLTGKVYGHNSDKIGSIGQIYVDDSSGTPNWVTVKTGLFGSAETFVPLDGARADGDDLYVAFAEDKINDAPRVDPDGSITPAEEEKLYAYYGLSDSDTDATRPTMTAPTVTTPPPGSRRRLPARTIRPLGGTVGPRATTTP